jgi:hypothetical protein
MKDKKYAEHILRQLITKKGLQRDMDALECLLKTSHNNRLSGSEQSSAPKVCPKCKSENYHEETDPKCTELVKICHDCGQTF